MGEHLDPQYLKETVDLIKELAGQSRVIHRELWHYMTHNHPSLVGKSFEERRQILGLEMDNRGHNGFSRFRDKIGSEENMVGNNNDGELVRVRNSQPGGQRKATG